MRVFFDTNVLLDVLWQREPFYHASLRLWDLAESRSVQGFISVMSFPNAYYMGRRKTNAETARQGLLVMRAIYTRVALDDEILAQALNSDFSDFEDAIQYFSAVRAGAEAIVTRNPQDFPAGNVPVMTPDAFLAAHFPPK